MGTPKGLLQISDNTLLECHIHAMRPFAESIIVVLGAELDSYRAVVPADVRICTNLQWATTDQAASVRLALACHPGQQAAWLVPVDTPPAQQDTLRRLLARGAPAVPVDGSGRRGHPALLGAAQISRLRLLAPDGGVRALLSTAPVVAVDDPMVSMNFNTPADWTAYLGASR
jgi:CTP:molybdopterin cytidylyltransferase MocA